MNAIEKEMLADIRRRLRNQWERRQRVLDEIREAGYVTEDDIHDAAASLRRLQHGIRKLERDAEPLIALEREDTRQAQREFRANRMVERRNTPGFEHEELPAITELP